MIEDLRIIDSPIGPVIPVDEVARHIGCGRATLSNTIHKPENRALFAPYILTVRVKGTGGYRDRLCITKDGMEELIAHMRPVNKDNRSERIGKFRRTLQNRKDRVGSPDLSDVLKRHANAADILIERWNYKPEVARSLAMTAAVEECPALIPYRGPASLSVNELPVDVPALPAPASGSQADPDFEKYHSLDDVARFAQCPRNEAHKILEDERVIECVGKVWRLTRYGERFGRMFPIYPLWPHRPDYMRWLIRYNPDAIQLVRGKLFCIQTTLAQRAKVTG